ncbi:hypothetical protein D3C84_779660 [compost metagenome]
MRPGETQRLPAERLCDVKFAPQQGLLGQPGQAHQPGRPTFGVELVERLEQVRPGRIHAPQQMQEPTLLSLPACDQLPLQKCRRLGAESRQLFDALGGLLEAPGEQQGRGDQADQLR